jgi:hypothetical protein
MCENPDLAAALVNGLTEAFAMNRLGVRTLCPCSSDTILSLCTYTSPRGAPKLISYTEFLEACLRVILYQYVGHATKLVMDVRYGAGSRLLAWGKCLHYLRSANRMLRGWSILEGISTRYMRRCRKGRMAALSRPSQLLSGVSKKTRLEATRSYL